MSMMFVADIHLSKKESIITDSFIHFLRTRAIYTKALYILGDLFEIWVGDDELNSMHNEIASALKKLTKSGVPCYFIHGNRDFLIGKKYANSCHMTLLPTQQIIHLGTLKIIVLHGDTLCLNNNYYHYFRSVVRKYKLQKIFLSLPLKLRMQIANKIRLKSMHDNNKKKYNSMDINEQTAISFMKNNGATIMIHGHTHKPAIHYLAGKYYRIVLGSWDKKGSAIEIFNDEIIFYHFFNH